MGLCQLIIESLDRAVPEVIAQRAEASELGPVALEHQEGVLNLDRLHAFVPQLVAQFEDVVGEGLHRPGPDQASGAPRGLAYRVLLGLALDLPALRGALHVANQLGHGAVAKGQLKARRRSRGQR